jgi:hypothetical protein
MKSSAFSSKIFYTSTNKTFYTLTNKYLAHRLKIFRANLAQFNVSGESGSLLARSPVKLTLKSGDAFAQMGKGAAPLFDIRWQPVDFGQYNACRGE